MSDPIAQETTSGIDQQGIDLVPTNLRHGKAKDLFFLWAGTTTNIFTVSYGALLVILFGLSFWQAIIAIVIGNLLAYPLLALASLQGPKTGTTNMTISRSSLGPRGARVNGLFSWLMLLGFEAAGLVLVYYAIAALLGIFGFQLSGGLQVGLIVVLGLIQMLLPLIGYNFLMAAQKFATIIFACAFVILAVLILPKADISASQGIAGSASVISAISFVIVSGGLSWACSGSNFSRYLPANTKLTAVGTWAALGGFVPYMLLQSLGAAMATVAVGPEVDLSDPLAVPAILPAGFSVPFLLLVGFGLMVQNGTNLYSSSLNLQTAGIPARRPVVVVTDSVICILITCFAVAQSSFYGLLSAFVGSLSIWLAPWVSVYLVDWIMRRGNYDLAGLMNESGGPYWGRGGVKFSGFIALIVGMIVSALFANTGYFIGPIAAAMSPDNPSFAADLAIPTGILTSGILYWVLNASNKNKNLGLA